METSITNANLESNIKAFKNSKYPVRMSDKCLEVLKKYFEVSFGEKFLQILTIRPEFAGKQWFSDCTDDQNFHRFHHIFDSQSKW